MTNYLIAGLGNIGDEYARTRHNIGFMILDALAKASNIVFDDKRYGFVATMPLRGNRLTLLKPSTYMNLSGNAVRYDFPRGGQVNWVLGEFPPEQLEHLDERINIACEAIKSFCLAGMQFTMNNFNNK